MDTTKQTAEQTAEAERATPMRKAEKFTPGPWLDCGEDMTRDVSAELRRRGIPHSPAQYDAGRKREKIMKTNITDTPRQLKKLVDVLARLGHRAVVPRLYRYESSDPTRDAQRNLDGRTHYADADNLRWYKSRILAARADAEGLLFVLLTSDAADAENRRRVYRVVAFDLFGTVIFCNSLEDAATTSKGARKHFAAFRVNLTDHYRAVLAERVERLTKELAEFKAAKRALGKAPSTPADPTPATV